MREELTESQARLDLYNTTGSVLYDGKDKESGEGGVRFAAAGADLARVGTASLI